MKAVGGMLLLAMIILAFLSLTTASLRGDIVASLGTSLGTLFLIAVVVIVVLALSSRR